MDDEIDLRIFVRAIVRRWWLAVGLAVVAATAAAGFSLTQPDQYRAAALVSIAAPRFALQFEGVSQIAQVPVRAYPELALSASVVQTVYDAVKDTLPADANSLDAMRNQLEVSAASDASLLRLEVRDTDPVRAANIADQWADVFARLAGQLYAQDQANLAVYEDELIVVQATLATADTALAEFQAENQGYILEAELDSQQAILTSYLNQQHELEQLRRATQALQTRLAGLSGGNPAALTDDLALLAVASQVYGGFAPVMTDEQQMAPAPYALQIAAGQPLAGPTIADQLALANDLMGAIDQRAESVGGQIEALQPHILELQGQLATATTQEDQLIRARDLAEAQMESFAVAIQGAQIALKESANVAQVASYALVPTLPESAGRTMNVLIAGVAGFMAGALLALVLEFGPAIWADSKVVRRPADSSPPPSAA